MGDKTGIQWTDATWNPIRGCSRVSVGCLNCYAETVAARFSGPGQPYEGLATRRLKVISDDEQRLEARWTGEVRFVAEHLADPLRWRKPRRIFVNSMSDLFHERLTNEQIAAVFGVMAAAPWHTFQVLTKRAKRMREWFDWLASIADPFPAGALDLLDEEATSRLDGNCYLNLMAKCKWPPPNVWLGVSVENQDAADERIPELLRTPAALRFLSCEPLLGPIHLPVVQAFGPDPKWDGPRIGWAIAGCESGANARPCEVDWLRSLRDQCVAADVPFFLKQAKNNEDQYSECGDVLRDNDEGVETCTCCGNPGRLPAITSGPCSTRKPGGIIGLPYLDGVQWAQFPGENNERL